MDYRHVFTLKAPLEDVRAFHSRADSMRLITPPPVVVRFQHMPTEWVEGCEMAFTLWMGPLPIRWRARIENITPHGFDDRQLEGPFESWVHHHHFNQIDLRTTEVQDWVEARLRTGGYLRWLGAFMWVNMPILFAFRGWQTRRLMASSLR